MARRITTGVTGKNILGSISSSNNTLKSIVTNEDIILEPSGTGITRTSGDLRVDSANSLRLSNSANTYSVALRSPGSLAANVNYTLPGTVNADYFLKTDASGNLSWAEAAVAVDNQTADNTTYFPLMTTSTSGTLTQVVVSKPAVGDKLSFQPSSGTLTTVLASVIGTTASSSTTTGALTVAGGVGVAGQLTATTIVETSSIALKENINPITNALELITGLKGVTYDRIDNNEHEAGLIAEWTAEVMPDMVAKDADGNAAGIKYSKLTAYLIEAVKTLSKEISELKGNK